MSNREVQSIYNKIFNDYKKTGSELIIYTSDYPHLNIQTQDNISEHSCNINYYIVNKRSVSKTNNYEYSYGCVYKLIDKEANIVSYNYREHKRIKTRTLYDILNYSLDDISGYLSNKQFGEYINPKYKKTIVDKLLILNYDKYNSMFSSPHTVIKINKCQICDSTEVCGETNINNEIIFYCKECNPYD